MSFFSSSSATTLPSNRCTSRCGVLGEARIVRDHANGRALAMQVLEQFHDGFAVARVQIAGGLVGQQDGGLSAQSAGHRHALLLTAGELRRIVPDAVGHADALQRLHHALLAIRRRHFLPVGQRQFDVLIHRQVADQVETLEDEADLLIADARTFGKVEVLHRLACSASNARRSAYRAGQ